MDIRTDRRGQTVQVGAVFLFGIAIVLFSTYQATIVPNQNAQTEFQHNQDVHSQLVTIRNTIANPPPRGESKGVQIDLGTTYSSRTIGLNPSNPSGSLRTMGTGNTDIDVELKNAERAEGFGWSPYWEGDTSFNSGALVYEPKYNEYQAEKVVYDNQALYTGDSETGTGTLAEPSMIRGNDIDLVMLTGSLTKSSSGTETFDVTTIDRSQKSIKLAGNGDPLTIQFHSRQPAAYWERLKEGDSGGNIADISQKNSDSEGWHDIVIELEQGVTYDVSLTKIGVGEEISDRKKDGTKISMAAGSFPFSPGQFETLEASRDYYLPAGTYEIIFESIGSSDVEARVNPQDENDLLWDGRFTPGRSVSSESYALSESGLLRLQFETDSGTIVENSAGDAVVGIWIRHAENN